MMELHRIHLDDEFVARDIPRIIVRAKRLQAHAEAVNQRGIAEGRNENPDMALCEASFPAVLYNSGVYHEVRLRFI